MLLWQTSCLAYDCMTPKTSSIESHALYIKPSQLKRLEGPESRLLAQRLFLEADIHLNCPMKPDTCVGGHLDGHGMAL